MSKGKGRISSKLREGGNPDSILSVFKILSASSSPPPPPRDEAGEFFLALSLKEFLSAGTRPDLESLGFPILSFRDDNSDGVDPEVGDPVLLPNSDFDEEPDVLRETELALVVLVVREPELLLPESELNLEKEGFLEAGPLETPGFRPVW